MGELQHGIYDDNWDDNLTYKEINILHGFSENGDVIDEEEYDWQADGDLEEDGNSDGTWQADGDLEENSNSDGNSFNYVESSDPEDLSSESCVSDMKVCFSYPESIS